jgi:hypothetical protein
MQTRKKNYYYFFLISGTRFAHLEWTNTQKARDLGPLYKEQIHCKKVATIICISENKYFIESVIKW